MGPQNPLKELHDQRDRYITMLNRPIGPSRASQWTKAIWSSAKVHTNANPLFNLTTFYTGYNKMLEALCAKWGQKQQSMTSGTLIIRMSSTSRRVNSHDQNNDRCAERESNSPTAIPLNHSGSSSVCLDTYAPHPHLLIIYSRWAALAREGVVAVAKGATAVARAAAPAVTSTSPASGVHVC